MFLFSANYWDTLCFFFLPAYPKSFKTLLGYPKSPTRIPHLPDIRRRGILVDQILPGYPNIRQYPERQGFHPGANCASSMAYPRG